MSKMAIYLEVFPKFVHTGHVAEVASLLPNVNICWLANIFLAIVVCLMMWCAFCLCEQNVIFTMFAVYLSICLNPSIQTAPAALDVWRNQAM